MENAFFLEILENAKKKKKNRIKKNKETNKNYDTQKIPNKNDTISAPK